MGVYKRGDTWCISYFLNGKRIRKAIGTKKDANKELNAILAKIDNRTFVPPREDSFEGLVEDYDREQREKAGYRSERNYIKRAREYFKGQVIQDIDVKKVEDFQSYLADLPVRGGGKRGSIDINHHMRCLHKILKRAVLRGWITYNPAAADRVERPPKGKGRTQYLQEEEVARLLDASGSYLRPIVLCAVDSGMRKSEILGLRWSEVREVTYEDKDHNKVTVPMIFLPAERTKTRTARKVPVSVALDAELKRLKEAQLSRKVITFPALVFHRPRPRKLPRTDKTKPHLVTDTIKNIDDAWNAAKRGAGIDPDLHFHDLRRTFRTHMKKAHVDSFTLNEIMGHANPPIEATYTQIDNAQLAEAISRIPKWHKSGTPESGWEIRPEGRYPQALALIGVESGA